MKEDYQAQLKQFKERYVDIPNVIYDDTEVFTPLSYEEKKQKLTQKLHNIIEESQHLEQNPAENPPRLIALKNKQKLYEQRLEWLELNENAEDEEREKLRRQITELEFRRVKLFLKAQDTSADEQKLEEKIKAKSAQLKNKKRGQKI